MPVLLLILAVAALAGAAAGAVARWRRSPTGLARRDAKLAVRAAQDVLERVAGVVWKADAILRAETGARAQTLVRERLERMPIDALRAVAPPRMPLARLEAADVRSVGQVLRLGTLGLDALAGIGPDTAASLHAAAARLEATVRGEMVPVPDPSDPADARLLAAAFKQIRVRDELIPLVRELYAEVEAAKDAMQPVLAATSLRRWLVDHAGKAAATAAAREFERSIVEGAVADLMERAGTAAARLDAAPAPAPELVRADWARRHADYASVLEHVIGATPAAQELARGGTTGEVAARVDAVDLQCADLRLTLRRYQEFGAKFIVAQARTLLGDEMGLGKTIQALAAMVHLAATEGAQHFLVVAPASVVHNWRREVRDRTSFPATLVHGADKQWDLKMWDRAGGVAIVSYETLRAANAKALHADLLVVDEAHLVKNPDSQRARAVFDLMPRCRRVALLTGTPLENHLGEFTMLLGALAPDIARDLGRIDHRIVAHGMHLAEFRRRASPVYLRRNQEDVLGELPERIEVDEWVELSDADEVVYVRAVATRDVAAMRRVASIGDGSEPSAKLRRLEDLLEEYREEGRKVLVFSFFLAVLDAVERHVVGCWRLDGAVPPGERQTRIDAFQAAPGHAVLIAQIEAGGVGVNLQAASVVVLMEPQWKPTTEWQAIGRAHRMGQTRRVVVHRLLADDTVDERIAELVAGKAAVFDTFARESALGDAAAASEASLARRVVDAEWVRLGLAATPGGRIEPPPSGVV